MRAFGLLLMIAGVALVAFSLTLPVSLQEAALRTLGLPNNGADDTYNIGLLHRQTLFFNAGLCLSTVGAVFTAAGYLARKLTEYEEVSPPLPQED